MFKIQNATHVKFTKQYKSGKISVEVIKIEECTILIKDNKKKIKFFYHKKVKFYFNENN